MENLELLKKVRRVEAPPFLLTRIRVKIGNREAERLAVSWQWVGSLAFGLLLFFNVLALKTEKTRTATPAGELVEGLQIQNSNQLYDE